MPKFLEIVDSRYFQFTKSKLISSIPIQESYCCKKIISNLFGVCCSTMDDAVCFKKISQSASAMGWSAANGYLYEQKYKRGKQFI